MVSHGLEIDLLGKTKQRYYTPDHLVLRCEDGYLRGG
jgi:hypothetical protein